MGLTTTWPAAAAGVLQRDSALDVVARDHLEQILARKSMANRRSVDALLRRRGEHAARWRPQALLGPDNRARRARIQDALLRGARDGLTHFGQAETARGAMLLMARRPIDVGPPAQWTDETGSHVAWNGRANGKARIRAYARGPCPLDGPCRAQPVTVPVHRSGPRFRLRLPLSHGRWTVELTADVGMGPEVAALAHFRVDGAGIRRVADAEGRHRRDVDGTPLSEIRHRHGVDVADADPRLRAAAEAHAKAVCRSGWARHRVDGNGPDERARARGFDGSVTEAVAVAGTSEDAWAALEDSPGHLLALLSPGLRAGVAEVRVGERVCVVAMVGGDGFSR